MRARRVRMWSAAALIVGLVLAMATIPRSRPFAADNARSSGIIQLSDQIGPATTSPSGFSPSFVQDYYNFKDLGKDAKGNPITGTGQTIAVIEFGVNPNIPKELETFIKQFKLPPMLGLNGTTCTPSKYLGEPCFSIDEVPNEAGKIPLQATNEADETALDIEWAHVAAPGANIEYIEGSGATTQDTLDSVADAGESGASVVSMSWDDTHFTASNSNDFLGDVAYVSGEGDLGYPETNYPAAYPYVLSVGGTIITSSGQTAWTESGGGLQTAFERPGYQDDWTSDTDRDVNDVAYAAQGSTPGGASEAYATFVEYPDNTSKWMMQGAVSAGIPQWAGIIADANQLRVSDNKLPLAGEGVMDGLYAAAGHNEVVSGVINKSYFTDISNGCSTKNKVSCAVKGYDYVTGLGTPVVNNLVFYLGYDI